MCNIDTQLVADDSGETADRLVSDRFAGIENVFLAIVEDKRNGERFNSKFSREVFFQNEAGDLCFLFEANFKVILCLGRRSNCYRIGIESADRISEGEQTGHVGIRQSAAAVGSDVEQKVGAPSDREFVYSHQGIKAF